MGNFGIWVSLITIFGFLPIFAILAYIKTRRDEREGKEKTVWSQVAGASGLAVLFVVLLISDILTKNKLVTEFQLLIGLVLIMGTLIVIWYKN